MREVLRVMAEWRGGIVRGGRAVQIADRAEGRLSHRCRVQRPGDFRPDRVLVCDCKLGYEVMRMLPVREDAAAIRLGDLEHLGVSSRRHGHGSALTVAR